MKKYKNKKTDKIAIVSSVMAAGMCKITLGFTMVVYKYEGDNFDFPFIMEHREFYRKHSEITKTL